MSDSENVQDNRQYPLHPKKERFEFWNWNQTRFSFLFDFFLISFTWFNSFIYWFFDYERICNILKQWIEFSVEEFKNAHMLFIFSNWVCSLGRSNLTSEKFWEKFFRKIWDIPTVLTTETSAFDFLQTNWNGSIKDSKCASDWWKEFGFFWFRERRKEAEEMWIWGSFWKSLSCIHSLSININRLWSLQKFEVQCFVGGVFEWWNEWTQCNQRQFQLGKWIHSQHLSYLDIPTALPWSDVKYLF